MRGEECVKENKCIQYSNHCFLVSEEGYELNGMIRLALCPKSSHAQRLYVLSTSTKSITALPLGANIPFERSCLVKCGLSWNPTEKVMIEADEERNSSGTPPSPCGDACYTDDIISEDKLTPRTEMCLLVMLEVMLVFAEASEGCILGHINMSKDPSSVHPKCILLSVAGASV